MGRLFFIALLSSISVVALARPWIGVVAAYGIVILTPQAVWWWNFDGLRPAFWVLLPTLIGFAIAVMRGVLNLSVLLNKRNLFMFVLWLFFVVSYAFGPYTEVDGRYRFTDPDWAFETFNKIFLLYFLACVCIDDIVKLRALVLTVLGSATYLIYWANDMYLSGNVMGRLPGPVDVFGVGSYSDENSFAMLFVIAQPFLWYMAMATERKWLRYAAWLVIPFCWHAVFLTASRGGLVGIGVTTLLMAIRGKSKLLGLLLIPAFIGAYFWQAGDLMKERAGTISEYKTETSASTRLEAWDAALGMVKDHPITGVGLASLGPAFPDYSDKKPREAHNTLFQISAESGAIAGLMYLLMVVTSIVTLWRNGTRLRTQRISAGENRDRDLLYLINEAVLIAFAGFATCALFISLQMSEIFYCLCMLVNAVLLVSARQSAAEEQGAGTGAAPDAGRAPVRLRRAPATGSGGQSQPTSS
jgi:putative inorganic carbon (HCO3(-)) transporter